MKEVAAECGEELEQPVGAVVSFPGAFAVVDMRTAWKNLENSSFQVVKDNIGIRNRRGVELSPPPSLSFSLKGETPQLEKTTCSCHQLHDTLSAYS